MDQVHKSNYEKVKMHEILHELIERKFPFLNEDEIERVYESVMKCVNFKDHVRKFFY